MSLKSIKTFQFLAILCALTLNLTSCSSDDNDDSNGSNSGNGDLIVNGHKWTTYLSAPNYDESGFYFTGKSDTGNIHILCCYEDLTEYEVGEEVTPDYLLLGPENAEYSYEDGEVTLIKRSGKNVTLKFDNYTVAYTGLNVSALGDGRGPDIANANTLKINGTVTFIYHTLPE